MDGYRAYLVRKDKDGRATASIVSRSCEELPQDEVIIKVSYSSLNYKDALSATGAPGVTKDYPHVPGIDAAGKVMSDASGKFKAGKEVLVTGYELGANHDGGYAEYIRVPADWVVPLPEGLTLKESMIFGTAGFTAALSLDALKRNGIDPQKGEVLVTGASGGVGSLAVALLARSRYTVVASTGKLSAHELLKRIGASKVIDRSELDDHSGRPLLRSRWAAAVDTVGGNTLSTVIRTANHGACIAACGLVAGSELDLTVFPFILRGVNLLGIDSAWCPMPLRVKIWQKLSSQWKPDDLGSFARTIRMEQLDDSIEKILRGELIGRTIVELN